MAYDPLLDAWIEAGKPTKEEIFEFLKANQESFNADIEALKQTAQIDIIDVKVAGQINDYPSSEVQARLPTFKSPYDLTITSAVITLLGASTSGALQVDIQVSEDNGINWSSRLTSPIEVTLSAVGSVSGSVNFINVAAQSFNQNDLVRAAVTGVQSDQGAFHISIYGEVS